MNRNISFSVYKLNETNCINKLYNEFYSGETYSYDESKIFYKYWIKEKSDLIHSNFNKLDYTFFSFTLNIERPTREKLNIKSVKECKIIIFQNIEKEVFVIPILNDLSLHIVARSILKKHNYQFYKPISDPYKTLFFSWIYNACSEETIDEDFNLRSVKSYKCLSEDKRCVFKGTTEASILDSSELKNSIVYDKNLKNLKLVIEYQTIRCDFTLSFFEEEYYKLSYLEESLNANLFKKKIKEEEFIIFAIDFFISKLKLRFEKSGWNKENHKNCRLSLVKEIKTELNSIENCIQLEDTNNKLPINKKYEEKKEETQESLAFFL